MMSDSIAKDGLTVEAVYDLRRNARVEPVYADTFFSSMSEAEWSELRKLATDTGKTDHPVLRCGDCRKAVYVRESWKGRRHAYHFAGDHNDCRWAGAVARNPRAIDAEKFRGQQEGDQHRLLRMLTAEVLAFDTQARAAGIAHHRYTKLDDGRYGYPDVYAVSWQGAPAAFEIQLSTTHLPVIARGEQLYEDGKTRLIWIIGYHDHGPMRRAFRDIYMRNDGQILGMDGEVADAAREAGEPRFRLYRLLPGPISEGFAPQWRNRIVSPAEINWGAPGDRPRSAKSAYDVYLNEKIERDEALEKSRQQFYDALKQADERQARDIWNAVGEITGGYRWHELPSSYDTVRTLGVLATLRLNRLCLPTRIPLSNLPHLVNSMLLEPHERRCWTRAFERVCQARDHADLLATESVQKKCNRNIAESTGRIPIDQAAGAVFDFFFPEGAFQRLNLNE